MKRFNEFSYWTESGRTIIADQGHKAIETFGRLLSDDEVQMWCMGYRIGFRSGWTAKAKQIAQGLGL